MDLQTFKDKMSRRETILAGSEELIFSGQESQRALMITMQLNTQYHSSEEVCFLMSELTGQVLMNTEFSLYPPFYTDFGLNIRFGKHVFVNEGCHFQDQGGITIGDDCLIGPRAMLITLNHDSDPKKRGNLHPSPIHIGDHVWLGANVTILPGVTIGDGAIIAAGAIVAKDVAANTIVAGIPAHFVKHCNE